MDGNINKKQNVGFTITELLIVIATIAVLATLLMPVLSHAKVEGMRASSMSDLKQTFNASSMYSNDFDSRVPYAVDECDWRGLCRAQADPTFGVKIQENHIPSFSMALQPYGFTRTLFKIKAGRGPEIYETYGSSYIYELVLSSAPLQPLEEHGCVYFTERMGANFWNGGTPDPAQKDGERRLTLYVDGQVKFAPYPDIQDRSETCRVYE